MTGNIYDEQPVTRDEAGAPTATPNPKVLAATGASGGSAALAVLLIWVFQQVTKTPVPIEVAAAFIVVVTSVVTFVAGYFKRPAA